MDKAQAVEMLKRALTLAKRANGDTPEAKAARREMLNISKTLNAARVSASDVKAAAMAATAPVKVLACFEDWQRPTASSQLVTVVERGPEWSTVRTSDDREFTINTVCLS